MYLPASLEKRFDFNLCDDECASTENLTMTDTDSRLFFYSVAKECGDAARGVKT